MHKIMGYPNNYIRNNNYYGNLKHSLCDSCVYYSSASIHTVYTYLRIGIVLEIA